MARKAAAIKQNAPAENMLTQYAQTMPQNWQQFGQNMAQAYPTPATGASRDQILGAVTQAAMNVGPLMTVYHGSLHRFDKFDASKIGTGEGAQAYGHGLYLAENPAVAAEYRKTLAPGYERMVNGVPYDSSLPAHKAAHYADIFKGKKSPQEIANILMTEGGTPTDIAAAKMVLSGDIGKVTKPQAGATYRVDLPDDHIAKMLDWDKPLSQQPEALKTIRGLVPADMLKSFDANVKGGISGSNAYKNYIPSQSYAIRDAGATNYKPSAAKTFEDALAEVGGDTSRLRVINDRSEAKVSEMLRAQGIPGIRYLDGGSRAGGAGTSNFVVFPGNEGLLKILERQ